jgi:hypothetical protein
MNGKSAKSATSVEDLNRIKDWFNGSQITNPDGTPLLLYHGTNAKFQAFDFGRCRDGAPWFCTSDVHARSFGPIVKTVHLRSVNPLEISQEDLDAAWDAEHPSGDQDDRCLLPRDYVDTFETKARELGYDALIVRNMGDRDATVDMYLPLTAEQIWIVAHA